MTLLMTELEVRLPDRRSASSFSTSKKPMAEVSCIMDNGRSREIVVPVRVGRLLMTDAIALPLPEEEAFDAIHALEGKICFAQLTEMLSRRDYAVLEARERLLNYGYREIEIDAALSKAIDVRFLDDSRFATYFISERIRRGWGRRKIEIELRRKGVDANDLPGYPKDFFSDDDELDRAIELLSRKSIPSVRPQEKLIRHLMAKGFSYSVSAEAARRRLSSDTL